MIPDPHAKSLLFTVETAINDLEKTEKGRDPWLSEEDRQIFEQAKSTAMRLQQL